ncbi:histamine H2 receptor-like [Lineus longissimus]|uniref:histamine H2 receptor-like n=1 Tax=Lineus longissimus TaxID=88925 RepID=UPI00315CDDB7
MDGERQRLIRLFNLADALGTPIGLTTDFTVADDMEEADIQRCIRNHSFLSLTEENRRIYFITNVLVTPVLVSFGLLANILTILVLGKVKSKHRNAVDFIMIILAVCDLTILVLKIPTILGDLGAISSHSMFTTWMLYYKLISHETITTLRRFLLWLAAMLATVRFLAIADPFHSYRWTKRGGILIGIIVTLMLTVFFCTPEYLSIKITEISSTCAYSISKIFVLDYTKLGKNESFLSIYPFISAALFFVMPFTVMLISNILLVHCIHKSVSRQRLDPREVSRRRRRDLKLSVMVCLIILNYFLTVFPKCLGEVYLGMGTVEAKNETGFRAYFLIVNCLSLFDSSINLLLYSALSGDFRKTFRKTFCCCFRRRDTVADESINASPVKTSMYSEHDSVFSCVPFRGSFRFLSRKITVKTIGPIQVHDQADISTQPMVKRHRTTYIRSTNRTGAGNCRHVCTRTGNHVQNDRDCSPMIGCRHNCGCAIDSGDLYVHLRTCIDWEHLEETTI